MHNWHVSNPHMIKSRIAWLVTIAVLLGSLNASAKGATVVDGNGAIKPSISRLIDFAHPPGSDQTDDFVLSE
jgi:hypothetical protein